MIQNIIDNVRASVDRSSCCYTILDYIYIYILRCWNVCPFCVCCLSWVDCCRTPLLDISILWFVWANKLGVTEGKCIFERDLKRTLDGICLIRNIIRLKFNKTHLFGYSVFEWMTIILKFKQQFWNILNTLFCMKQIVKITF